LRVYEVSLITGFRGCQKILSVVELNVLLCVAPHSSGSKIEIHFIQDKTWNNKKPQKTSRVINKFSTKLLLLL